MNTSKKAINKKGGANMKYFYLAISVEENRKFYAYLVKISSLDNVLSKLKIRGILWANIYPTKEQAAATVKAWNATYKANGNYLFDNPNF